MPGEIDPPATVHGLAMDGVSREIGLQHKCSKPAQITFTQFPPRCMIACKEPAPWWELPALDKSRSFNNSRPSVCLARLSSIHHSRG